MDLLTSSWVRSKIKALAEVEIIDVQPEKALRKKWADFIVRSHYRVNDDFNTSLIALFPRRSCDAIWNQAMNLRILDRNPAPRPASFVELWDWHGRFVAAESQRKKTLHAMQTSRPTNSLQRTPGLRCVAAEFESRSAG